jgi:hypothetical protein
MKEFILFIVSTLGSGQPVQRAEGAALGDSGRVPQARVGPLPVSDDAKAVRQRVRRQDVENQGAVDLRVPTGESDRAQKLGNRRNSGGPRSQTDRMSESA